MSQNHPAEELSTEIRTFLIADIRGYTKFTQECGDEAAARLAAKFAELSRSGVAARGGEVIELRGDEALAIFTSARQALRAAVELQSTFALERANEPGLPLWVGIGLDAGEAVRLEGGYRGGALNLAARLASAAGPGEVLATETVIHLGRKVEGIVYGDIRSRRFKGFEDPIPVVCVQLDQGAEHAEAMEEAGTRLPEPGARGQRAQEAGLPTGGFLGALPQGPLAGRVAERRRLVEAVESAAQGYGRFAALSGEPGVGKTRLAQEASILAHERGLLVETAGCREQRQTVPFYPFIELLGSLYRDASPAVHLDVQSGSAYLARLLPGVDASASAPVLASADDEERLFRAVDDFVRTIADTQAVALMVDDLQWADASSLALLQHLVRSMRASRVFLLGAYRDAEIDRQDHLEALLLDLNRDQLVDWIEVKRMTRQETEELIGQTIESQQIDADFIDLLHHKTDGNPFFLRELLWALQAQFDMAMDPRQIQVPERVRAVVEQRVLSLSMQAQETLHEASIFGASFHFDDLRAMSGRSEEELERALEEAMKAGLVQEVGVDEYAFTQPLTGQSLYEGISGRRRRRLHRAAGEALERSGVRMGPRANDERVGGSAAEIAYHFLQGDDRQRAIHHTIRAGDEAESVYAHRDAEEQYRTALEILALTGSKELEESTLPLEASVLEKLSDVLRVTGRFDDALELLERAAQIYDGTADVEGARRLVAHVGMLLSETGRAAEGMARLRPLLDAAGDEYDGDPPSRGLALLCIAEAQLLNDTRRYAEAVRQAERGVRQARLLGDDRVRAEGEIRRGAALGMLGQYDEAQQSLEAAVALAESGDLGTLTGALIGLGTWLLLAGRFEESARHHARVLELAARVHDPRAIAFAQFALGGDYLVMGDWKRARRLLQEGAVLAGSLGLHRHAQRVETFLAHLSVLEGDFDVASERLEQLRARALSEDDAPWLWDVEAALAELELMTGRYLAARDRLEPCLDLPDLEAWDKTQLMVRLTRAYLGLRALDQAEATIVCIIDRATSNHDHPGFMQALSMRGSLRARQERWAEAGRLFEGALVLARAMPYPYEAARALREYGVMSALAGDSGPARQRLTEALKIYRRLGARADAERTLQAVAELGAVSSGPR